MTPRVVFHVAFAASAAFTAFGSSRIAAQPTAAGTPAVPNWSEHIRWDHDGPEAREHASVMVFSETAVVYGGSGYSPQLSPLGDAWAFDQREGTWRAVEVRGDVPTPGGSKRVAQTPQGDSAYLFGGYGAGFVCNNELHRVSFDGEALVFERIEQHDAPRARALHAFGFDPASGRLVVALGISNAGITPGSFVGEFDADGAVRWRTIEGEGPSPRFGFAFAFDTDSGDLVTLSGQLEPTPAAPMGMTDELWTLNIRGEAPVWTRIDLEALPAGRRNPCFAFDDNRDALFVWCGTADGRSNVPGLIELRREDGGTWALIQHADDDAPPRRSSGFGFAGPASEAIYLGFGNSEQGTYTDWVRIDPGS